MHATEVLHCHVDEHHDTAGVAEQLHVGVVTTAFLKAVRWIQATHRQTRD